MKAKQTITEIDRSLGRSRSTISHELSRGRVQRGYRAEQACAKATARAQRSRNGRRVDSKVWSDVDLYLSIQWRPEQNAGKLAGHWEGDTVLGAAHKQAIVTLVERKGGFAVLAKVPSKSADLLDRAIEARLLPLNSPGKDFDGGQRQRVCGSPGHLALGIQT